MFCSKIGHFFRHSRGPVCPVLCLKIYVFGQKLDTLSATWVDPTPFYGLKSMFLVKIKHFFRHSRGIRYFFRHSGTPNFFVSLHKICVFGQKLDTFSVTRTDPFYRFRASQSIFLVKHQTNFPLLERTQLKKKHWKVSSLEKRCKCENIPFVIWASH